MKYKILPFTAFLLAFFSLSAQKENSVFAITGDNTPNSPFQWTNITEVDAKTGQLLRPVYTHLKTAFDLFDGLTKRRRYGSSWQSNQQSAAPQMPTSFVIAAAAYDAKHHRMFVTPMQQPELRWINLDDHSTAVKIYTAPLPMAAAELAKASSQVTRMVIAADGYGYALTNDANHLIRFSTGDNTTITDLGSLQDAAANGTVSVHSKAVSFGGDMVAAANGDLYLFSAYHAIFKIDVIGKTAVYIGTLKNLPSGYTANGAAVDAEGALIVGSAIPGSGYYRVNMNTWEAVKMEGNDIAVSVSDLASGNFAFQNKLPVISPVIAISRAGNISIYPNPLSASVFHLRFAGNATGRYTLQLADVNGRITLEKPLNLLYSNQVMAIELPAGYSKGMYMIKLVSADGKTIYTSKLVTD